MASVIREAVVLDKAAMLSLYRQMQTIRQCEEQLARAHQRGLIHGACHTYVGEEAVAAGVCATCGAMTSSSALTAATATLWPKGSRREVWSPSFSAARAAVPTAAAAACTFSPPKSA